MLADVVQAVAGTSSCVQLYYESCHVLICAINYYRQLSALGDIMLVALNCKANILIITELPWVPAGNSPEPACQAAVRDRNAKLTRPAFVFVLLE